MMFYFQEDGTWTDIPRCIEHDPGVDEQIPGTCPSIPGYCAQGFLNQRCTFDCVTGPVSFKQKKLIEYILINQNIRYIVLNWVHPRVLIEDQNFTQILRILLFTFTNV